MGLTLWYHVTVLYDVFLICTATLIPNLRAILAEPSLLLHPNKLRAVIFFNVWAFTSPSVDQLCREVKESLVRPNACGVVLDLGAGQSHPRYRCVYPWGSSHTGHGHTLKYLDNAKVTRYIALEPNAMFHDKIRETARAAGFAPSDVDILGCGAEQTDEIIRLLGGRHQVDTIISTLTLCRIPDEKQTIERLCTDVLKPRGGQLLFYEHVLCDDKDVAFWQRVWTPLWQLVVGCYLDRPTHKWVDELDVWATRELSRKPDEPYNLWWHQIGRYVR
jgi:hypothetical protein